MTSKYVYKGMDLTLDIYETNCRVVQAIADRENISFDDAYLLFSKSHTYWCLQTPATLMWSESVEFILDEFYREQNRVA